MYIQLYTICMLPKTPYKVHCTTVQCMLSKTPYKVHCTTVQFMLPKTPYKVHSTLYTVQCTMYAS